MNPSQIKKCKMATISSPYLNGVHIGLIPSPDGLTLCPKTFACCAGTGWQDSPEGLRHCEVKSRLARAREVEAHFQRVWGRVRSFEQYLSEVSAYDQQLVQGVSAMIKGYAAQCRLIENSPLCIKGKPSACWAMALSAAWRFGHEATVIPFHSLRLEAIPKRIPKGNGVLFVEQIDGLYNAATALKLEYLIDVAYACNVFLVLEVLPRAAPKPARAGAMKAFQRRIAADQDRPFYEFLQPDSQSKLGEMLRMPNPKFATAVDPILDDSL